MTDITSLLASRSVSISGPGVNPVPGLPLPMENTGDNSLQYESDEKRWSRLMVNAQAGDEKDYQVLLTELTQVIHGFLRNRFGIGHFVEDCVQETLIAIHQARHTYDRRRPFRPWLVPPPNATCVISPRRVRPGSGTRSRLLNALPEPHREVLVLTKIIGFSVAETAERLGISQSLVKVRVHRAIRRLRHDMEAETL